MSLDLLKRKKKMQRDMLCKQSCVHGTAWFYLVGESENHEGLASLASLVRWSTTP